MSFPSAGLRCVYHRGKKVVDLWAGEKYLGLVDRWFVLFRIALGIYIYIHRYVYVGMYVNIYVYICGFEGVRV